MLAGALILGSATASAQDGPKFSADVPESVTTPDRVETCSLGTLEFFDGMPSPETARKAYDNLDLIRATTAFLDGIPVASIEAMVRGLASTGL